MERPDEYPGPMIKDSGVKAIGCLVAICVLAAVCGALCAIVGMFMALGRVLGT